MGVKICKDEMSKTWIDKHKCATDIFFFYLIWLVWFQLLTMGILVSIKDGAMDMNDNCWLQLNIAKKKTQNF